jgi:hypothetical protein
MINIHCYTVCIISGARKTCKSKSCSFFKPSLILVKILLNCVLCSSIFSLLVICLVVVSAMYMFFLCFWFRTLWLLVCVEYHITIIITIIIAIFHYHGGLFLVILVLSHWWTAPLRFKTSLIILVSGAPCTAAFVEKILNVLMTLLPKYYLSPSVIIPAASVTIGMIKYCHAFSDCRRVFDWQLDLLVHKQLHTITLQLTRPDS